MDSTAPAPEERNEEVTTVENMAVIGLVTKLEPIEKADMLLAATVECGQNGSWRGVVSKRDFAIGMEGAKCVVFMPDAIVPPLELFSFMSKYHYRVKMQKLRGARSEVLIMPVTAFAFPDDPILFGDMTAVLEVKKFTKAIPKEMRGKVLSTFPNFLRKTDEINYQKDRAAVDLLMQQPSYMAIKYDGSSMTVFKTTAGDYGVCSRNMQLDLTAPSAFAKVAEKYDLANRLPCGVAIQAELVGPGIQGNRLNLADHDMRVFNVYFIDDGKYGSFDELSHLCEQLSLPLVEVVFSGVWDLGIDAAQDFSDRQQYMSGVPAEGVVWRALSPYSGEMISVKIINQNYKD